MSSDSDNEQEPVGKNHSDQYGEMFRNILQRGINGELPPSELASQILTLITERVASADPKGKISTDGDTPGLEETGWTLWGTVDVLAREDVSHHDLLIDFINAFYACLRVQEDWSLWGCDMVDTNFLLGPAFRESLQGAGPDAQLPPGIPGATEEEQRITSWCNYCRFVARMTRDTEQDFSLYLLWFAREALEDCTWCVCENPDAAILALEGVIEIGGPKMFESDTDFGKSGDGGDGARQWTGKSGFCRERWMFWETELLKIAGDTSQYPARVKDSARRTAANMKSIREGMEA